MIFCWFQWPHKGSHPRLWPFRMKKVTTRITHRIHARRLYIHLHYCWFSWDRNVGVNIQSSHGSVMGFLTSMDTLLYAFGVVFTTPFSERRSQEFQGAEEAVDQQTMIPQKFHGKAWRKRRKRKGTRCRPRLVSTSWFMVKTLQTPPIVFNYWHPSPNIYIYIQIWVCMLGLQPNFCDWHEIYHHDKRQDLGPLKLKFPKHSMYVMFTYFYHTINQM